MSSAKRTLVIVLPPMLTVPSWSSKASVMILSANSDWQMATRSAWRWRTATDKWTRTSVQSKNSDWQITTRFVLGSKNSDWQMTTPSALQSENSDWKWKLHQHCFQRAVQLDLHCSRRTTIDKWKLHLHCCQGRTTRLPTRIAVQLYVKTVCFKFPYSWCAGNPEQVAFSPYNDSI